MIGSIDSPAFHICLDSLTVWPSRLVDLSGSIPSNWFHEDERFRCLVVALRNIINLSWARVCAFNVSPRERDDTRDVESSTKHVRILSSVSRGLNFAWHHDTKIARSQNLSSSITIYVCTFELKFKRVKIRVYNPWKDELLLARIKF